MPGDVTFSIEPDRSVRLTPDLPIDLRTSLRILRRGGGDPCTRLPRDHSIWRVTRFATGACTFRLSQRDLHDVTCHAWGLGADELVERLPDLLGARDDLTGFDPEHELLVDSHKRNPGLRIIRTGQVFEALVPAVLEQRVKAQDAFTAWRQLVTKYGEPAPGPVPAHVRVAPTPEVWGSIPSWEWMKYGVEHKRSNAIRLAAQVAGRLEECSDMPLVDAVRRLAAVPGIGVWTAAEIAQRALGDTDALSVGDFHLCGIVGWALFGCKMDDDQMVEALEPWRPHRYRVARLLYLSGNVSREIAYQKHSSASRR